MKKFLKISTAVAVCLATCFFASCGDSGDNEKNAPNGNPASKSLKSIVLNAKVGDTIDLGSIEFTANEKDSYTVSKDNLTIKNGNVKNATFIVTGKNVKFESLRGIDSVIIDEAVGDGDFTMANCYETGSVYVNGGGNESVHISQTQIGQLSVNKENVRVFFKGSTKVETAFVLKNCKLESENSDNSIKGCIISDTVTNLNLAGNATIGNLVSEATDSGSGSTQLSIEVADNFTVTAADEAVKSGANGKLAESGTVDANVIENLKKQFEDAKKESVKSNIVGF